MLRTSDSQSAVPGFESTRCCFVTWSISFTARCFGLSVILYINPGFNIDRGGSVKELSTRCNCRDADRYYHFDDYYRMFRLSCLFVS